MTDSDQPFLWQGAKDYSEGRFYEPRFYGQDYNTFMESLFAVPLIWLHVPVFYALPAATHFIFLYPFIFTAVYLFAAGKKTNAIITLLILLCTTPAFDIMTSIPRGFVTGMFFCSFFVISFLHPENLKLFFFNGSMLLAGIFVNPNCLIAGVPFVAFLWLRNIRNSKFYLTSLLFVPVILLLYLFFDKFYDDHPEFLVYEITNNFGFSYFKDHLLSLDTTFAHINFFEENKSVWILLTLLLLLYVTFRQNKRLFASILILLCFILATFLSGKTRDGTTWPFYSIGRIYLVLPFTVALLCSAISIRKSGIFIFTILLFLLYPLKKIAEQKSSLAYHTQNSHFIGVHLVPVKTAVDAMTVYRRYCRENKVDYLIISNIFWLCTFLNYGGTSIYDDYPATQETWADRRYWVWHGNSEKIFNSFLVLSINNRFDEKTAGRYPFETVRLDDYGLFLIKNNTMKNGDFIKVLEGVEVQ